MLAAGRWMPENILELINVSNIAGGGEEEEVRGVMMDMRTSTEGRSVLMRLRLLLLLRQPAWASEPVGWQQLWFNACSGELGLSARNPGRDGVL